MQNRKITQGVEGFINLFSPYLQVSFELAISCKMTALAEHVEDKSNVQAVIYDGDTLLGVIGSKGMYDWIAEVMRSAVDGFVEISVIDEWSFKKTAIQIQKRIWDLKLELVED